ncbi:MAG: DMT family transporter [Janthinobacterium lividum]
MPTNVGKPKPSKQTLAAHLSLIAVTFVWGTTFPLVKAALRDVSPLLFNFLRMVLAASILATLNWRTLRGLTRAQMRLCGLAGILLALGYEVQTVGLTQTTPSKSAFLTGLVVVFVPLLSALPGVRQPQTPRPHGFAYAGAFLAFAGLILLTSEPGAGLSLLSGLHLGEWLTLGCAVAFAFHLLTLARAAGSVPPRVLGTLQIAFAALAMLLFLPLEKHQVLRLNPLVCIAFGVTSILATAAAFTIQSWAQQHLPASHTALIFTLEPVFAWLTSLIFFGERLGSRALGGATLILGGIVLAELGPTALSQTAVLPMEP